MVIDRYRATTAALGYTGDSVINSLSDIADDGARFPRWRASCPSGRRSPCRGARAVPLFVIRDNLTLNVIVLIRPIQAIRPGRRVEALAHRDVDGRRGNPVCNHDQLRRACFRIRRHVEMGGHQCAAGRDPHRMVVGPRVRDVTRREVADPNQGVIGRGIELVTERRGFAEPVQLRPGEGVGRSADEKVGRR